MIIQRCPNPKCDSLHFRKYGSYYRRSEGKWIKRWRCQKCHLHFSSATFQRPYRQHKRRANPLVHHLLSSGVSQRRIAILLNLPASGPLAELSRLKYGPRRNQRPAALHRLFGRLKGLVHPEVRFQSDQDPLCPIVLRKTFPKAEHARHPGGRGCITGQGELKKLRYDPLFSLNHTCGMLWTSTTACF
jgi:hypothetical protein